MSGREAMAWARDQAAALPPMTSTEAAAAGRLAAQLDAQRDARGSDDPAA